MKRVSWTSAFAFALLTFSASAQNATTELHQRCATRLSGVLLGKTPTAALLSSADPQVSVDTMLAAPEFVDRFARWVSSHFNVDPGDTPPEDASYFMAKYVL